MNKTRWTYLTALLVTATFLGGCGMKPNVVHISSNPSGAMVFYNDKVIGEDKANFFL